ncbi:importin-5-like [Anastrepha ludens]|uniref:importin-5-like n=1 Tax=Anastrepha ludens TaxID=28586 RepID=UPI0023AEB954|nr:importin-5-like [Anastrepha ludens]
MDSSNRIVEKVQQEVRAHLAAHQREPSGVEVEAVVGLLLLREPGVAVQTQPVSPDSTTERNDVDWYFINLGEQQNFAIRTAGMEDKASACEIGRTSNRTVLEPNRSWSDRQWGVCAFDDVIEFCGPACAAYQQIFTPPLLQYVTDKSPEVRQAAAYGCGVLGQFGGEHFAVTCAQIIPLLVQVISDPKSRDPENVNPTENAIAAVSKILKYNSSAIQNVDEIINVWFSWLPVTEDADEAPHIYGYMCDLIQANHPIILGNNNSNLPRIVSIIAQAFVTKVVAPLKDVGTRMLGIVKQVEANPEVFQACASILTPEQQYALQDAYRELAAGAVPATA